MGRTAFIVVVGALVAGGIFYFINRSSTNVSAPAVIQTSEELDGETITLEGNSDTVEVEQVARYQVYSPEILSDNSDKRRVLFFYANWCPTCKPADESFKENMDEIPSATTVIRVNYNDNETDQSEKDLARKYGVTYQHTFVQIDEQGNEVSKWNGGDIDELLTNIQ